jgi:hypothetical protein
MSTCNIDHTNDEVMRKLQSQIAFLPKSLFENVSMYLQKEQAQNDLNELFHLLKKYDLLTIDEQEARNLSMNQLLSK